MTHALEPSVFPEGQGTRRTPWHWRMENSAGEEVPTSEGSPSFPSQSDAESWVGEVWRELLEEGVDQVRLFEGDREVYGPMSLHPPA